MAGQAAGEAPSPLHIRTGIPLPWLDHASMSVPSGLVTCCEVTGEEVRAIGSTPVRRSGQVPVRRARSAAYRDAMAIQPRRRRCAERCDAVEAPPGRKYTTAGDATP